MRKSILNHMSSKGREKVIKLEAQLRELEEEDAMLKLILEQSEGQRHCLING